MSGIHGFIYQVHRVGLTDFRNTSIACIASSYEFKLILKDVLKMAKNRTIGMGYSLGILKNEVSGIHDFIHQVQRVGVTDFRNTSIACIACTSGDRLTI